MTIALVLLAFVGLFAAVAGVIADPAPVYLRLASIFAGVLLVLVAFGVLP